MQEQTTKKIHTLQDHFQALENMTDNKGILQHESNPEHHYSIDDQARALIVLSRFSNNPEFTKENLASIYLNYILNAKRNDEDKINDKWFNNYKSNTGEWITHWKEKKQTPDTLQDCYGRTLWALSEFLSSQYSETLKQKAENLFFDSLDNIKKITHPHSMAFTSIALSKLPKKNQTRKIRKTNLELNKKLTNYVGYPKYWMTYCIARIPQALFLAGKALKNKDLIKQGEKSLELITNTCFNENEMFHFIQNQNECEQPVEAGVATETYVDAYNITKENIYKLHAKKAFEWFDKENFAKQNLIASNGAVYDGIEKDGRLSTHCGAESIVVYMMAFNSIMNLK